MIFLFIFVTIFVPAVRSTGEKFALSLRGERQLDVAIRNPAHAPVGLDAYVEAGTDSHDRFANRSRNDRSFDRIRADAGIGS